MCWANGSQGQTNKNGKGDVKIKDGEIASSATTTSKIPERQRSLRQERKRNALGKERDISTGVSKIHNKGKDIMREDTGMGKGILGSGPAQLIRVVSDSRPKQASDKAFTSAQPAASPSERPKQSDHEPSIVGSGPMSDKRPLPLSQPPIQLVVGPKGTKMHIMDVSSSPKKSRQPDSSFPTAAERTKSNRNARLHPKKGSTPVKLQASKALHIWSPLKDKKNKSRARLATLTLQKINAWTGAAAQADRSIEQGVARPPHLEHLAVVEDMAAAAGTPL
ncbi:unnamed protein product [Linum trigynum]|uniref:Uncharacterized protein n=1 Tax=Linum trigynum TaxID=586398 RepID=A0AAV2F5J4_9ROSI